MLRPMSNKRVNNFALVIIIIKVGTNLLCDFCVKPFASLVGHTPVSASPFSFLNTKKKISYLGGKYII
jgi:hypothetical protein